MMKRDAMKLLLIALCLLLLCACTGQSETTEKLEPTWEIGTQDKAEATLSVLEQNFRTDYVSAGKLDIVLGSVSGEDAAYLWGCNFQTEATTYWAVSFPGDGQSEDCSLAVREGGVVTAVDATEAGIWYVEKHCPDEETTLWYLHTPEKEIELNWVEAEWELHDLAVEEDGVYLAAGPRVLICGADGQLLRQIALSGSTTGFLRDSRGELLVQCDGLYRLNQARDAVEMAARLPQILEGTDLSSGRTAGYDVLAIGETYLYGWKIEENLLTQILSFDTYGLDSYHISELVSLDEEHFLGSSWRSGEPGDRVFRLSPSDEMVQETILRVAGISRPMVISSAIADFKAMYPEYTVEYTDYRELYGDQALEMLQMDLIQGEAPDVLFLSAVPTELYARRGLLEDLYPWIEQDLDLNINDFTPNLLQTLENGEGKLYQLPQSYTIATTATTGSLSGDRQSWSFADVNAAMEQNPAVLAAFYGESGETLTSTLPLYMIRAMVNYDEAQSYFDTPEGHSFLTFLSQAVPSSQLQDMAEDEMQALRQGQILFAKVTIATPFIFDDLEQTLEDPVYPGYPDAPGGSFYLNLPMAIPASATEKEGAWAWIKMLISSDYYATRGGWIPLQEDFEDALQEAVEQGVSEESMEKLRTVQQNVTSAVYYDEAICAILRDETSYLFGGARSVEETARQLDSRVTLYLTEQFQ